MRARRRGIWLCVLAAALLLWPWAGAAPADAQDSGRSHYHLPDDFPLDGQTTGPWYFYESLAPGMYEPLKFDKTVEPWGRQERSSWNSNYAHYLEITAPPDAWILPGEGANTAVGWKAPRAGRIEISGIMTATSTSREYGAWCGPKCDDGIYFSLYQNYELLIGPVRVLHGSREWQSNHLGARTTVKAGDFIYFYQDRGNWQDADHAYYDFSIDYLSDASVSQTSFQLPGDTPFDGLTDPWYFYQVFAPGMYEPLQFDNTVDPWGRQERPSWNSNTVRYLQIAGPPDNWILPGEGADAVVGWRAPRAGRIHIISILRALSTSRVYGAWCGRECDDGIYFSIYQNDRLLAGPVRVLHGSPQWQRHHLTALTGVEAGDFIYFYVGRGNWQDNDHTFYNFRVDYLPGNADSDG